MTSESPNKVVAPSLRLLCSQTARLARRLGALVVSHGQSLKASLVQQVGHMRIDGRSSAHARGDAVNAFQTDPNCRVALLSIRAAGVSPS